MQSLIQRLALMAVAGVVVLGTAPASANAQKALVYCPVSVDATGCSAIVNALSASHPLGVDRGFDGTAGTVDLKTVDLFTYSVFVVPSLADNATAQPYAKLREPDVRDRLRAALIGRIALWSGSPDQGATNRALKDALIQNLAGYAGAGFAAARGPGLVGLLDASSTMSARYDWVRAITPVPVGADANLLIYNSARSLNATATTILTSLGAPIADTNMATYGFTVPSGAAGVSLDAVGQTGTSIGGQVVLLTMEAANSGSAIVSTEKDDYVPYEVVGITGSGFQPGETVTLTLVEDPELHASRTFTVVADTAGAFLFEGFSPDDHDAGIRFVLIAAGQSSGRRAQNTFTDAIAVGASSANSNSGSGVNSQSLALSAPAVAANDVLIAQIAIADAITNTFICPPAGWTSIRKTTRDDKLILETFWFRAGANAGVTTHTWQFRTSSCGGALISGKGASGGVTLFTGVATTGSPVDVSEGSAGSSSGPFNAPTATTTTANARILRFLGVFKNLSVTHATVARIYNVGSANQKERTAAAFDGGIQAAAGATGTFTATFSTSAEFASQTVALKDACVPASITTNPANQSITYGANAVFTVVAAGTPAPTVQWQVSTNGGGTWTDLGGETSATLTLTKPAASLSGNQYRAVVTNSCATAMSTAATLTVAGRAITVTADAKTKVYGDADPALTYSITSGSLASGDALSGALVRAAGENVGTYAITQGTLALSSNYNLTFVGSNLTITARPLTVTADAKAKVYGDADPAFTYQLTNGTFASGDALSGALARVPGESVGSYALLQGTLAAGTNYAITFISANLTITARPITVTADAKSKVYGDAEPNFTYQVTTGALVSGDVFTGALTRAPGENLDTYAILQGTLSAGANYDLTYVGANLTITTRPITVTADAKTKVYGNTDPALTYQITGGSLAFTDTFTGALARVASENVGTYAIQQGTLALSSNYDLTFVGASVTITPRPITLTADPKTKVYGEADPALTYQLTGTLVDEGDLTGALARDPGETVGTYAIAQGTLAATTNYTLTFVGASLTITPRPIMVTANPQTKVYGEPDPTLTHQITTGNLAFSDAFSGALVRVAGEDVGSYAVNQGTLTAGTNYTLTYVSANLTITTRPVTITADAKTKVYGDPDPALTHAITSGSLVQQSHLTGALTRLAGETVGSYQIQQGTLALTSNYALTYAPASLAITPRALTVTADNKTKIAGAVNPALTGSIIGIQFSDNITPSYSTTATTLSLPANYPITPALNDPDAKLGNYTVAPVNGTLSVTPNAVPVLGAITAPLLPTALGTAVNVSVPFTDTDVSASEPYTATIDWGNGTTSTSTFTSPGTISGSKVYPAAGVYTIKMTIAQDNFPTTHFHTRNFEYYVVVYDPNGGFVTGGGWINSPAGAYYANPTLTGKAHFGFVSKYKRGQSTPDGNTEFQYQTGNVNFKGTSFDWLVIAGTRAQFKGSGTINGSGDYGFMLTAIDAKGSPDTFRMKIWVKATGVIVYDNLLGAPDSTDPTTVLGGGSIQIHDGR